MEILVGQANLIVHARFGGSTASVALDTFLTVSAAGFEASFGPQAKVMHRLRPRLASTVVSLEARIGSF